jgi:sugar phosphate isomerase/epimerase
MKPMSSSRIGFMQGRLSPIRNNRIQSFPWETWKSEFEIANSNVLLNMEWTIDSEKFAENPLVCSSEQERIRQLSAKFNVAIPSVTCDYFMENPPWINIEAEVAINLQKIMNGMSKIGSTILVIPLVDNSSLTSDLIESQCIDFFQSLIPYLQDNRIRIAFESDFAPKRLENFIANFDVEFFGINYDIGNSASLGFNPTQELEAFGERVINVHVKDRSFRGTTVPLGEGSADFPTIFRLLEDVHYNGNLIMQTARDVNGQHIEALLKYKQMTESWLKGARNE